MAEKIVIEVYKTKNAEDFTKALAEQGSKLEAGSACAYTAAMAAALAHRAAAAAAERVGGERAEYILRNTEIIRGYMVHLIDEDVKSRGPLHRALKEGSEREIEASRQPACCIPEEIINMMGSLLELTDELSGFCPEEAMHYLGEAAELALGASKAARVFTVNMADQCSDETFRFVARRENDIMLGQLGKLYASVTEKTEKAI